MNAIGAHAQGFMVNDELLLRISEGISQCSHSIHPTLNCSKIAVCVQ